MPSKTRAILQILVICLFLTTAFGARSGEIPSPTVAIIGQPRALIEAGADYSFTPIGVVFNGNERVFQVENCPHWASFDPIGGDLTGTPGVQDVGEYGDIRISLSSGNVRTNLGPFRIVVIPPVIRPVTPMDSAAHLSWDLPTANLDGSALVDLAGYIIYSGQNPLQMEVVGTVPRAWARSWRVTNLPSGRHYFAITSLNLAGAESPMSRLVSKDIP